MLHIYPSRKKGTRLRVIIPVIIIIGIACIALSWFLNISDSKTREHVNSMRQASITALRNCYAIEGSYPQDISYLEQHYGLIIDHKKYIVSYDFLGSNILPDVRVRLIGSGM